MKLPLANGKYRDPARKLVIFLGFLALAVWFFHFYVWYQYDGSRPTHVDSSLGRVFPLNTHGHTVYLTKSEDQNLAGLTVLTFGLFISAVLIDEFFVDGFTRTIEPWQKRQW
jgi:hypothetical protein